MPSGSFNYDPQKIRCITNHEIVWFNENDKPSKSQMSCGVSVLQDIGDVILMFAFPSKNCNFECVIVLVYVHVWSCDGPDKDHFKQPLNESGNGSMPFCVVSGKMLKGWKG